MATSTNLHVGKNILNFSMPGAVIVLLLSKKIKRLESWNTECIIAPGGSWEDQMLVDVLKKLCACFNSL